MIYASAKSQIRDNMSSKRVELHTVLDDLNAICFSQLSTGFISPSVFFIGLTSGILFARFPPSLPRIVLFEVLWGNIVVTGKISVHVSGCVVCGAPHVSGRGELETERSKIQSCYLVAIYLVGGLELIVGFEENWACLGSLTFSIQGIIKQMKRKQRNPQ